MVSVFTVPGHSIPGRQKKTDYHGAKKRVRAMLRKYQESAVKLPSARKCALYRHFDNEGNLLYVGISLSLVNRLMAHRSGSGWYAQIARVEVEWFDAQREAEEAERVAIHREGPVHNRQRRAPYSDDIACAKPKNPLAPAEERLSVWVAEHREAQGLSLEDLAELSGISSRTIARVESDGAREKTSLQTYAVLIQALGGRIEVSEEHDNYVMV